MATLLQVNRIHLGPIVIHNWHIRWTETNEDKRTSILSRKDETNQANSRAFAITWNAANDGAVNAKIAMFDTTQITVTTQPFVRIQASGSVDGDESVVRFFTW